MSLLMSPSDLYTLLSTARRKYTNLLTNKLSCMRSDSQVLGEYGMAHFSEWGNTKGKDYCIFFNSQWARLPQDLSKAVSRNLHFTHKQINSDWNCSVQFIITMLALIHPLLFFRHGCRLTISPPLYCAPPLMYLRAASQTASQWWWEEIALSMKRSDWPRWMVPRDYWSSAKIDW